MSIIESSTLSASVLKQVPRSSVAICLVLCVFLVPCEAQPVPPPTVIQPPPATQTAVNCSAEQLAGTYRTAFGALVCKAAGSGLACCYGSRCANTMELAFDASGRSLAGSWKYPNGRNGAVIFPVSSACALESGQYDYAERAGRMSRWVIAGRADAGREANTRGRDNSGEQNNAREQGNAGEQATAGDDPQNRASGRRPVSRRSESNNSKVMATFRTQASWGDYTRVEAAAQVRLLENGDGEMRIEVAPSSSAFKFFAEPHAAVLIADRNGRVISSRTVTELAMSMGPDVNRKHGVAEQVIPSGDFKDGEFAFFRLKFCGWQMNFARTVQASNGCYRSSIRNELRQFTIQLPSSIGQVRSEIGQTFELLEWQGMLEIGGKHWSWLQSRMTIEPGFPI